MIVLLDEEGNVVATLDLYDAPADSIIDGDDEYVFEGMDGLDRVYRRQRWGS